MSTPIRLKPAILNKITSDNKKKELLITISFYLVCILAAWILEKILPGDMCNPGMGIFLFFFILPVIIVCLIIRNFMLLAKGKKEHVYSFWAHLIIMVGGFIWIKFFLK